MFLEITDATAIVLMILFSLIAIFFSMVVYRSIKKESIRYKEEKSISIEGLLSRTAINSQISSYLSKISTDSNFSLLLLEIQQFDDIVDAFGKREAERALEKVIYKVIHSLPKRVQIANYGGTRFLLFLKTEYDRFFAIDLARKIISLVNRPIKIFRETNINFVCNVGISFYPKHGTKFKQLINSLNIALYNAIKAGENKYIIYSQNMKSEFSDNIEYHFEIKEAIEKREFILQYQPIIDIANNKLYGFEAYVRWQHPKHGILSPVQFLNIMEQSGDITWIGSWGLESVIKESYNLNRIFDGEDFKFTINISPRQLMDNDLVNEFGKLLKKYKMNASKISLEIQEYSTYEKNSVIKNNLNRLRRLGFRLAINGFGLDYATLTNAEFMQIDTIRLDKQFFEKEKESYLKDKLTSIIVEYANQNNKVVIAEGIETVELLEMVRDLGIKLVQGYIYSKPLLTNELNEYIQKQLWKKYNRQEKVQIDEEIIVEENIIETKEEVSEITEDLGDFI